MSKLRIRNGPYNGREITLAEEPVTVGRDAEATVQILDRSASRVHAEVFPVGGMYFVRDLDSKNGTLINDTALTDEELLREGDVIKIGSTELAYESGIALAEEESHDRIAYDDELQLVNTIEFRIDDLSDIEDEQDQKDKEGQEARSLRILYQISKLLSNPDSVDACAEAMDFLIAAMPADNAIVFLRQGASNKLVPKAVRSSNQWSQPVIARSIIKRTLSENRAVLTENAKEDSRFKRNQSVSINDIRSVICVPVTIKGSTRGVLYLSRGGGIAPFQHEDLELLSACAVQLGLFFMIADQVVAQQKSSWEMLCTLVSCMESGTDAVTRGKRTAQIASLLSRKLHLNERSRRTVRQASLLYHACALRNSKGADGATSEESLEKLNSSTVFEGVADLIVAANERLDGTGPAGMTEEELQTEGRLVAVAVAFEAAIYKQPLTAIPDVLVDIGQNEGLDQHIVTALSSLHVDGKLIQEN